MSAYEAIKVAIDVVHVPSRVRWQQSRPLPNGITEVLRIAAGDEERLSEIANALDRPPKLLREAAAFFIEQILLFREADSFRVLGANENATPSELRRNMALLLRFLHPDVNQQDNRSIFAGRITQAWEDLKTPERRAAYESQRRRRQTKSYVPNRTGTPRRFKSYASRRKFDNHMRARRGLIRRAVSFLLGRTRYSSR